MSDHEIGDNHCPSCNTSLSHAMNGDSSQEAPKPVDLSVCFECGEILVFTPEMKSRSLSAKEFIELPDKIAKQIGLACVLIIDRVASTKKPA